MSQNTQKGEKAAFKYEIAERLGVSQATLKNWLNVRYYDELKELGYKKYDHLLSPKVILWLKEKLCFE